MLTLGVWLDWGWTARPTSRCEHYKFLQSSPEGAVIIMAHPSKQCLTAKKETTEPEVTWCEQCKGQQRCLSSTEHSQWKIWGSTYYNLTAFYVSPSIVFRLLLRR